MELFEASNSWIIALGKTLLNSLWLGLLFLSMLKILFLIIPRRLAAHRYHAALITLFLFTAICSALFLYLFSPTPNAYLRLSEGFSSFSNLSESGNTRLMSLYQYISIIYLAGMGIYLSVTILGLGKIKTVRRSAESIKGEWFQRFSKFKANAGIKRKVEFLESNLAQTPFLTGIIKPAIIVPSAMLSQLSFREIESILMHELYHLKQLDPLVNLIQKVVEMLFFFNPAIWFLSKMISSEREKRCDDLVLKRLSHPLDYARALFQLSLQQQAPGTLVSAAAGKGKRELKSRIERILKPNTMNSNFREKLNVLILFFCGIAVMLLVSGFTSGLSIMHIDEVPVESDQGRPIILRSATDTLSAEEKERIQKEVEVAIEEAMASIDWEEMREELEEIKIEVMEEINWEQIKEDMEVAKRTAMEEVDWEQIKKDMEDVKNTVIEEIDWEEMKIEMEEVKVKLDLMMEDFKMDMDFDMDFDKDVDVEVEENTVKEKRP